MARKKNEVTLDIRNYPHNIIMGVPKVGKTTLFRDLVILLFKDASKGLLIACGQEYGYKGLDDLWYEEGKVWDQIEDEHGERGIVQIVDEVIALKGTDEQIDTVCFDTLDELVEVATKQVYEEHRNDKLRYPKSLNEALGGYGAGQRRVMELIKEQIQRLEEAGIAVFIIAHTKVKEMEDPQTGEKYEMITNNLDSRFYSPIANTAQMIVNIVIDRKIVGAGTEVKKVKDKEIEVAIAGKQASTERFMYFRDNNFVDAGGRFEGLPEKLPLSAENFVEAFKMGVTNSQKNPMTKKQEAEKIKKEDEENKQNGIKTQQKEKNKIVSAIKDRLSSGLEADVIQEVNAKVKEYGIKSFSAEDLADVTIEQLRDIYSIVE